MTRFTYSQPRTLDAAWDVLETQGGGARILAGGTDLLVRLRTGHTRPRVVLDIKRVDGLEAGITRVDSAVRVGALCTMTGIVADARIREHFPALIEAARVVGSIQIRNRATLAGNLCNASPAADTAPALLAYGAVVNVAGRGATRRVPLAEFFLGPGKTVLQPHELVTSVDLPLPQARTGAAFARLTRRRGVDLATLTVCSAIDDAGRLRVALGAVAPTPLLVTGSVAEIQADPRDPRHLAAAAARIAGHASPISDVRAGRDYRLAMLPIYISRTLALAFDRLKERDARA